MVESDHDIGGNGTLGYQLTLNRKFGSLRDGIRQPALDNFVQASMNYTIRTYRPDMMFVHLTDLDTQRHHFGVHSKEAHAAIERHDRRVGELMHLLHRCGMSVKRDTTVVLLGDHSQLDVQNIILINRFLREQGYIRVQHGRITDWKLTARIVMVQPIFISGRTDWRSLSRFGSRMKSMIGCVHEE